MATAWLHEPKLDGYRFQIVKDGDRVRLYSRSGYEWTKRLAGLATALADIRCESAVIDGELFFPNASGNPEFRGLQAVIGSHRQQSSQCSPSIFCTMTAQTSGQFH